MTKTAACSWRCLDAASGAQRREDALLATRPPREADAPAVPDQQVREDTPVLARDDALEVALDLDGVLLAREAEALREAPDVGVDDDALRLTELGGDDVCGLPRDSRQ